MYTFEFFGLNYFCLSLILILGFSSQAVCLTLFVDTSIYLSSVVVQMNISLHMERPFPNLNLIVGLDELLKAHLLLQGEAKLFQAAEDAVMIRCLHALVLSAAICGTAGFSSLHDIIDGAYFTKENISSHDIMLVKLVIFPQIQETRHT